MCLLANTSEGKPHKNKSLICVPLDQKGVNLKVFFSFLYFINFLIDKNLISNQITRTKLKKLGNNCSDTAIVSFDNVHVPVKNVIGEMNSGFTYQMLQFQEERLVLGPLCYGKMCFKFNLLLNLKLIQILIKFMVNR